MALVDEFDEQMLDIYRRALSEAHYNASRFLQMLNEYRGLANAKILINAPRPSEGYTALCLLGRLDLTVEAVIYDNPKWHPLFTSADLEACIKRLKEYRYIS